jgi:hypothetical protein
MQTLNENDEVKKKDSDTYEDAARISQYLKAAGKVRHVVNISFALGSQNNTLVVHDKNESNGYLERQSESIATHE